MNWDDSKTFDENWAEVVKEKEAERAQFIGTIVSADDDSGELLLTYSDGRKIRLIGEWWEWKV